MTIIDDLIKNKNESIYSEKFAGILLELFIWNEDYLFTDEHLHISGKIISTSFGTEAEIYYLITNYKLIAVLLINIEAGLSYHDIEDSIVVYCNREQAEQIINISDNYLKIIDKCGELNLEECDEDLLINDFLPKIVKSARN